MDLENDSQDRDWVKLVEGASILNVYPGTLYRRWRYRQFPSEACRKIDGVLYFERATLEAIRDAQS